LLRVLDHFVSAMIAVDSSALIAILFDEPKKRAKRARGHQDGGSKAKDQSENSSVHGCVPPYFHSSNNEGLGPRDLIQLVSLSSFNIRQGGEKARTC
jgi:hypothetical protein